MYLSSCSFLKILALMNLSVTIPKRFKQRYIIGSKAL
jgi:hypothetical protein